MGFVRSFSALTSRGGSLAAQPKIWSMIIVDTRLLFSVTLRDDIFNYVIAYFEIFGKETSASISLQPSNSSRKLVDRSGQKASLADFMHDSRGLNKRTLPSGLLREIRSESLKRVVNGEDGNQAPSLGSRPRRNTRVLYRVVQVILACCFLL